MAESRQCIRQCLSIIGNITKNTMKLSKLGIPLEAKYCKILLPPALDKFLDNLNNLMRLEKTAFNIFENQIDTIFHIPGADAFVSLNQITFVQRKLDRCLADKAELLDELQNNKDEINALGSSISEIELEICQIQDELFKINYKIKRNKQERYYLKLIIDGAKRRDKTARAKYFENLQAHKLKLCSRHKNTRNLKRERFEELKSCLISLKGKLEHRNHLLQYFDSNETRATDLEEKLVRLKADMNKLADHQTLFEEHQNKIGLRDERYVGFLAEFREFSQAIKIGAESYAPIMDILTEIKSVIQSPIELMVSEKISDVELGHEMLLPYCPHLLRLSRSLRKCITNHHHKRSWLVIKE